MEKVYSNVRYFFLMTVASGSLWAQSTAPLPPAARAGTSLAMENYGRLPLAFEKQGERFVARGQGYTVGVDSGKALIQVVSAKDKASHAVSLEFAGAHAPRAVPGAELPGKVNYIRGNDPKKWQIGLATYGTVTYPNTYPGIDIVYYGNQQQLEFDFVVKPGADPRAIRMKIGGGSKLSIDRSGALRIGNADDLRLELPKIYQEVNGGRKSIAGHYAIHGRDEVAFNVDSYDLTRALVIDPTIVYSTLFGGGLSSTYANGIGVDTFGNILIAGITYAADFPTVNAAQNTQDLPPSGFITKINAAGTALLYSTYLGGSRNELFQGLVVDASGSAWVTGYTGSVDFPVMNAAQPAFGGGIDAVVAKLDSSGVLQFSTYLGGNSSDVGYGIAVDGFGNGYVTGVSCGSFPTTVSVLQPPQAGCHVFATKYGPSGAVLYSALLGGNSTDVGYGIGADPGGNAYITGYSDSSAFTGAPAGGPQPANNGGNDAFVAKLNSSATALVYFTFLGGTGTDTGKAIAVDSSGKAYIAGQTSSTGLATAGAAQTALSGGTDGFAAQLNAAGTAFTYVTYLGGGGQDYLAGLALDASGNVYLAGYTDSPNFPTASAVQATKPGNATGLFQSTNSAGTWSAFDSNLPATVFDISLNPVGSSAVVLTENGIYRTVNGGVSWTQQLASGQFSTNSSYLGRSPAAPGTIYVVACCNSGFRSTDDGVTWNSVGNPPGQSQGILAAPLTAATVYVFGANPPVSKSTDGGVTWNAAGTGLPATVTAMTATSDGALYAGTNGFGIYKSTNQGASWTAVNNGVATSAYAYPHSLSASGTTVYFAYGTIYETNNGGASWTSTPGYVGAGEIAVSPQNTAVLYALTFGGAVQESSDSGTTWNPAGTGLPSISYYNSKLVVDPVNSAHALVVTPVSVAAFVAKVNSTGSALTWSTYLGGSSAYTYAYAIATDGAHNAFVTGYTGGGGFPVTSAQLPSGAYGAFITKISDATASCSEFVSPASVVSNQNGGVYTFSVVAPSGCSWTASTNQAWAVVNTGASGVGSGSVTIQISNNAGATQSAILTVGTQYIIITQAGASCAYGLDKNSYSVANTGGTVSAVLTATAGCPWAVTNNNLGAVAITSGPSGTGNGTINLTVTPNPSNSSRQFYLSVGTNAIQITQQGSTPALASVTPNIVSAHSSATSITITGSKFGGDARVSFTPPNGAPTTITPSQILAAQIAATIPATLLTTAGIAQIAVQNGTVTLSNQLPFTITSTKPAVSSVNPNTVPAHSPGTPVTIVGSNFANGATVFFTPPGGSPTTITPSQILAAQIAATIPSALLTTAGTAQVAVQSVFGELSTQLPFTITTAVASKVGIFRPAAFMMVAEDVNGNIAWDPGIDRAAFFGTAGDTIIYGDWDGSGTTKVGIFRASAGMFALDMNGNGAWDPGIDTFGFFGQPGDVPIVGDWNGDGRTKVGIYRPSTALFAIDYNGNLAYDPGIDKAHPFGLVGDTPIIGDWNGDGQAKVGVFRSGLWILDTNNNLTLDAGDTQGTIGQAGDTPLLGDWNGDGRTKVGIYRSSVGMFAEDYNGNLTWDNGVDRAGVFGAAGSTPVVGDWTGTGITKVGVFYGNGYWGLDINGNLSWDAGVRWGGFGSGTGDTPVVGKW